MTGRSPGRSAERILRACLLFAACFSTRLAAQSTARVDSFYSTSVHATVRFAYILPSSLHQSAHYPVLYLLHGHSGDYLDWSTRTGISRYVRDLPVIVIMPDGKNSWYVNSVTNSSDRYEDYLINDLPKYVQSRFPVDTTRQGIAGLSMGGDGALVLAMRYPGRFRFAGSLSGAITVPHLNADTSSFAVKYTSPSLIAAFGTRHLPFWDEHDVFDLFPRLEQTPAPYLYLSIGSQDGFRDFVPAHHRLIDSLRTHNIAFEYHETPGGHSWKFWDREIQPLLKKMTEIFDVGTTH